MQRLLALFGAFLAFAVLCFFCIRDHAPAIQQDITARVSQALETNQVPPQALTVDGRDVVLKGPGGSREVSNETRKLVEGVEGVRSVQTQLVENPEPTPDAKGVSTGQAEQGKIDSLLALGTVEFNPSSARLTPRGRAVLDKIAPVLAGSSKLCEIQGHTDSQGRPDANMALSYKRAIATKNYLVNKGISPERLLPKAFGGTQPLASNNTAAGRRKNRRINFVLKEKA